MGSIANAYIPGTYKYGSIHSDTYSIRVANKILNPNGIGFLEESDKEYLFRCSVYIDALDRPYVNEVTVLPTTYKVGFISLLLRPENYPFEEQRVTLDNGQEIWVDFSATPEKELGFYKCDLTFREGHWIFVTKGVDIVIQH